MDVWPCSQRTYLDLRRFGQARRCHWIGQRGLQGAAATKRNLEKSRGMTQRTTDHWRKHQKHHGQPSQVPHQFEQGRKR